MKITEIDRGSVVWAMLGKKLHAVQVISLVSHSALLPGAFVRLLGGDYPPEFYYEKFIHIEDLVSPQDAYHNIERKEISY